MVRSVSVGHGWRVASNTSAKPTSRRPPRAWHRCRPRVARCSGPRRARWPYSHWRWARAARSGSCLAVEGAGLHLVIHVASRSLKASKRSRPANDSLKPNAAKMTSIFSRVRCCATVAKLSGRGCRSTSSADQAKLRITSSCSGWAGEHRLEVGEVLGTIEQGVADEGDAIAFFNTSGSAVTTGVVCSGLGAFSS